MVRLDPTVGMGDDRLSSQSGIVGVHVFPIKDHSEEEDRHQDAEHKLELMVPNKVQVGNRLLPQPTLLLGISSSRVLTDMFVRK